MSRYIFFFIIIFCNARVAKAQDGIQPVQLVMADAIEIGLHVGSGVVNMEFNSVNDYANGIISDEQVLKVRSNKKYNVRVKANTSRFAYTGAVTDPKMSVNSVLKMKVSNNSTGGTISSGYSSFKTMSTSGSKIIDRCTPSGNSTFSVQYQATPGFTYPAGTYTVDIVYTATQA